MCQVDPFTGEPVMSRRIYTHLWVPAGQVRDRTRVAGTWCVMPWELRGTTEEDGYEVREVNRYNAAQAGTPDGVVYVDRYIVDAGLWATTLAVSVPDPG